MTIIRTIILWANTGKGDAQETAIECRWAPSRTTILQHDEGTPLQAIDISFLARSDISRPSELNTSQPFEGVLQIEQRHSQLLTAQTLGSEVALQFLKECLGAAAEAPTRQITTARFVVPLRNGTIVRSDIVSYRLRNAFWVDNAVSFASPLQVFSGVPIPLNDTSFANLFQSSAGAILIKQAAAEPHFRTETRFPATVSSKIEADFKDKLSLVWISTEPIARKRLVLVGSSNQDPEGGGWTQFARHATVALGIDLIIIDREDGWLGREAYRSWYTDLLTAPASWWAAPSADGLVQIIEGYRAKNNEKIDGLATFIEALQVPVSAAAAQLKFPQESTSAFERATNKYNLGSFQKRSTFLTSNAADVLSFVNSSENDLSFPLIIKPCFGLNSEGVTRVDKASEIESAIHTAKITGRSKREVGDRVLVERYCDGPEVDVNMVFADGEVLFSEICDDFPKGADLSDIIDSAPNAISPSAQGKIDSAHRSNFQETNMVYPSALPGGELEALRNAVKDTILGLGFRNGVMHVEARVAQSECSYQSTAGIVDLQHRQTSRMPYGSGETESETVKPSPWIIEINTRPPGLFASQTPASVYGIDYWGISLLLAVGDKQRVAALSQPFKNGAQVHAVLVMIRAEFDPRCEGIFDSGDICEDLLARHPDLKQYLGRYGCLLKKGQKIPQPTEGRNTFVAYLNVLSRTSRLEALRIAQKVRDEIRYEIR